MDEFRHGYFKAPNSAYDVGLTPCQIAVYLYLVRCGNNTDQVFPGLRTIEKKCNISRPTVTKTLEELEVLGLLKKEKRPQGNGNKSNSYVISEPVSGKVGLPPTQTKRVRNTGKAGLPPVVKEIDRSGKAALPNKELVIKEPVNKEKRYVSLPSDVRFLEIYDFFYDLHMNKDHPQVTEHQLKKMIRQIKQIQQHGVDEDQFKQTVDDYFIDLPPGNDGKIFAFLQGWRRHFDKGEDDPF